jgi:hypothetical protein
MLTNNGHMVSYHISILLNVDLPLPFHTQTYSPPSQRKEERESVGKNEKEIGLGAVTHTSYAGGRNQKDHSFRTSQTKS